MAIAAVTEAETRLCGNCKKDIPVANFIMHEIHCSKNIEVCRYCSELIPKSEMKNHIESEHVQVTCKCRMKIEKCLLQDHEESECPLRPASCQYCDIQLAFNKLQDHEIYCGARTERCGGCGHNIMVKDLKEHPQVCGQEVKQVRRSRTVPRFEDEDADLHTLRDIRNRLRSEDELEQLERNENTHSSLYEEWNDDLDYVLALSLQNENNPHSNTAAEIPSDFWEKYYTKESVPLASLNETDKSNIFSRDSLVSFSTSDHLKSDEIIMLPCEFCEELYPAEDLILHQTGCNPASAFASFSKRSSSPHPQEHDGLRATGSKSCRSLSSSQPQAVQAERDIMIPCEFCGIELEEETLFHHQEMFLPGAQKALGSRGSAVLHEGPSHWVIQQTAGMRHCPLRRELAMLPTREGSPGRRLAAREGRRTEVRENLQVGQCHMRDLLRTSIQKPSHPAPREFLQPNQAPATEEEGASGRRTGQSASGAGMQRQKPRAQHLVIQRSDPPLTKNMFSTLHTITTHSTTYLTASKFLYCRVIEDFL
ncbi:TRAF-type zinc finger domain-containing protein 1 isoform X2 [Pelecanus crispus]|uniref:TRAF-type zinc finger domain-containing protein 1 isoform X2 n=1 Tax=Pelecanus crispus TaxID=36300 RepID=UPI003F5D4536